MEEILGGAPAVRILTVSLVLAWAVLLLWYRWQPKNLARKSCRLAEASASRQLMPRFDPWISAGDTLIILGRDGCYEHSHAGEQWIDWLQSVINRGCKIVYILVGDEISDEIPYQKLINSNESSGFNVCIHPTLREITKKYEVFHPTILKDQDGKVKSLWVENYHPSDSAVAYDVEFYYGNDVAGYEKLGEIIADIEQLIKSAKLITSDVPSLASKSLDVHAGYSQLSPTF